MMNRLSAIADQRLPEEAWAESAQRQDIWSAEQSPATEGLFASVFDLL